MGLGLRSWDLGRGRIGLGSRDQRAKTQDQRPKTKESKTEAFKLSKNHWHITDVLAEEGRFGIDAVTAWASDDFKGSF